MKFNTRLWLLGLTPLVLLAVFSVVVLKGGLVDFLGRGLPPVEELSFERVTLAPGVIAVELVNGGPDPVTVAQVMVDEAFRSFTIEPSATIPRLGRATIEIPYPWVQDEAHGITLLTSTGVTFEHEIELATATPVLGARYFLVFGAVGLYVGVIPVLIGLLWFPFLRRLERRWIHFMLALTAGLLVFLGVDALEEGIEAAHAVAGAFQAEVLVLVGAIATFVLLQAASHRSTSRDDASGRMTVALLIAMGIGLHNLGEGLAIGAAYSLGEAALGAFLIIGFMLHNTTEGLGIVAPIASDRPRIRTLAALGAIAGVPTILGAWIGGLAYSPLIAVLFLSVGAGAIAQVVVALYRVVERESEGTTLNPITATGIVVGFAIMYGTGLFVAV
ncbi:MAG: ZIP family metal transporter [Gemmatimonadetes bacterium]|nr:ZIP family metal transporter [Gemmatimonadota bacterium]